MTLEQRWRPRIGRTPAAYSQRNHLCTKYRAPVQPTGAPPGPDRQAVSYRMALSCPIPPETTKVLRVTPLAPLQDQADPDREHVLLPVRPVAAAQLDGEEGSLRSVADITDKTSLAEVREYNQSMKARV